MDEMNLRAAGGQMLLGSLENPNRMPFSGVLTYLDAPSDQPPGGSGGRRVVIPLEVGRNALESLKGMPINLAASMDDHDTNSVVGIINDAYIGDTTPKGVELRISGHIFAKSFPDEAYAIKASQKSLGFSYETSNTRLEAGTWNGEPVAIARSLVFTGAAILYKKSAAYQSTSLAASADVQAQIDELKERLAELEAKKLTESERKDFALPSKQMFPMPDAEHVRLAWDMVDRAKDLSDAERAEARRNILKRAHELGVDTSDWHKPGEMKASNDIQEDDNVENTEQKVTVEIPAELTAAIAGLADAVKALQADVSEMKASAKEIKPEETTTEVTAAKDTEPQRRSIDSAQLIAKFEKKDNEGAEIFAAIDKKGLSTIDSMAEKLKFFQN